MTNTHGAASVSFVKKKLKPVEVIQVIETGRYIIEEHVFESVLPFHIVEQDDHGNRREISRHATPKEALEAVLVLT